MPNYGMVLKVPKDGPDGGGGQVELKSGSGRLC